MSKETRTEAEYVRTMSAVLEYVQTHLDGTITPGQLSEVAGFSQHHFHRVFRSVVGEAVMDHVRRLRLERAALQLKTSDELIASIAFDAGYQAQEAFTRTFQAYYGLGPREFRAASVSHQLPSPSGVHYSLKGFTPLVRAVDFALLETDQLCALHRQSPLLFEEKWEELMSVVTGFSEFVTPFYNLEEYMLETISDIDKEISALQNEVEAAKQKLLEARKRRPKELVQDYVLLDSEGAEVRLSELFGDKPDLIFIHNMGTRCSYCTMWADGFTGLVPHLSDRAAFVVCSPDKPEVQKRFASNRNWNFKMLSSCQSQLNHDLGFWKEDSPWPGVSTFRRTPDGQIFRIAMAYFSPQDDFCAVWPLLDLLEEGPKGWGPQYDYEKKS